MKSFGLVHIFFLLFLLTNFRTNGQDYLITSKGDSVAGQLKPLLFGVDKKVQVTDADKKKHIYPIFQVKLYSYKNEIYQPIKGPDGYTFMKRVKSGYLSLYYYQLANQVTFDGTYLMRRDGKGMDVPNLGFKKVMKNYLKDCESVSNKIDSGELGKKELNDIIDQYNQCIEGRTAVRDQAIAVQNVQTKQLGAWDLLEQKVKDESDFDGKTNALEMIQDIKGKIAKSEKIPNFLIDGLKSSLNKDSFKTELENALKEIN